MIVSVLMIGVNKIMNSPVVNKLKNLRLKKLSIFKVYCNYYHCNNYKSYFIYKPKHNFNF